MIRQVVILEITVPEPTEPGESYQDPEAWDFTSLLDDTATMIASGPILRHSDGITPARQVVALEILTAPAPGYNHPARWDYESMLDTEARVIAAGPVLGSEVSIVIDSDEGEDEPQPIAYGPYDTEEEALTAARSTFPGAIVLALYSPAVLPMPVKTPSVVVEDPWVVPGLPTPPYDF